MFRLTKFLLLAIICLTIYITFFGTYKKHSLYKTLEKTDRRIIAITFDDGPVDSTLDLLDSLSEVGIKAAFFVIGEEASKRPDVLQRIVQEGHIVGNHSWDHPHALGLRRKGFIENQIDKTNTIIKANTGKQAQYVRAPFGESTPYSDFVIRQNNMIPVHWTLSFTDWKRSFTTEDLTRRFREIDRSEVILLHDRAYQTPEMRKALVQAIQELQQRGYEFVTLDQVYF